MNRRRRSGLILALGFSLAVPTKAQNDVDLTGGAFNDVTTIEVEGTPGRKYLLMISVFTGTGMSFIPNTSYDVGDEFLNFIIGFPGFVGALDNNGQAQTQLVLPYFPILEAFPLYLQLLTTGTSGNKLVDASQVQIWTGQTKNTYKSPFLGTDFVTERSVHSMTPLADGETILIAGGHYGGITGAYGQDTAEIYDRRTENLTGLANTLVQARTGHTGTLLNDGRVLLAGGADEVLGEPTDTAEVYDPVTQTFSSVGDLSGGPRALHRAVKLQDGRVLLVGGTNNYNDPSSIILGGQKSTTLFDPATDTFSPGPDMSIERLAATATLLPSGNVLVAGGYTILFGVLPVISDTAEVYQFQPGQAGLFGSSQLMFADRFGHSATLLDSGETLVVGGANGTDPLKPQAELTWELFNETFGFINQGPIHDGRILPSMNTLLDGKILITGGAKGELLFPVSVKTSEIWDPITQVSTVQADLLQDRAGHMGITLPDGTVLLTGGGHGDATGIQTGLTTLEIYQP